MISSQYSKKTDQLQLQKLPATKILNKKSAQKINLCSGPVLLDDYINIDLSRDADITLDLEKNSLPFPDESVDVVACISAINYFYRERVGEIIKDVYRVLKPGGIARFASQNLQVLAKNYIDNNIAFYFEKLPNGQDRFPGKTIGDKFNEFFYGFRCGNKHCKYVFDFNSLKVFFEDAGFSLVEQKKYLESRISDVDKLDNRPEQMFFLEAIKGNARTIFPYDNSNMPLPKVDLSIPREHCETKLTIEKSGSNGTNKQNHNNPQLININKMQDITLNLGNDGKREKAWQCLLQTLEVQPDDLLAVNKCADILKSLNRFEDMTKLCTDYLKLKPDDFEIKSIFEEAQAKLVSNKQKSDKTMYMRGELDKLNQRLNNIQPDQVHLSACLHWLVRAQDANGGGGVASAYNIDSLCWGVDYPETTGYIIPTFLGYYKLTGNESYLKRAIEMGDWEIAIQWSNGGIGEPVGVYGLRPSIFNTAQVIIGWVTLYKETGQDKYLSAAHKAANWIIQNQNPDGKWTKSTYAGPKAYHIRVAWSLLELYAINENESYRIAAERSVNWVLSQGYDNGWFANNSLSDPDKPWTHLIGYVLGGLLEIYRIDRAQIDRQKVLSLLHNAAKGLAQFYTKFKETTKNQGFLSLPEAFDRNWSSTDCRSCVTGNAQIEFFLRRIFKYTNDPMLQSTADSLLDDLKQMQLLDGVTNPDVFGGLAGSHPIGAGYLGYAIPNWGVKFFADCLLQKLLAENTQKCLG